MALTVGQSPRPYWSSWLLLALTLDVKLLLSFSLLAMPKTGKARMYRNLKAREVRLCSLLHVSMFMISVLDLYC